MYVALARADRDIFPGGGGQRMAAIIFKEGPDLEHDRLLGAVVNQSFSEKNTVFVIRKALVLDFDEACQILSLKNSRRHLIDRSQTGICRNASASSASGQQHSEKAVDGKSSGHRRIMPWH